MRSQPRFNFGNDLDNGKLVVQFGNNRLFIANVRKSCGKFALIFMHQMLTTDEHLKTLQTDGFTIIDNIYTTVEADKIIDLINQADTTNETFRKSSDLFAIRQFLKEIPKAAGLILNPRLKKIVEQYFGSDFFVVKSIYFDKPEVSNWYVSYHQDLTISVDRKTELQNFGPWTVKQNQFAVQPPIEILQNIFTIRIHLDDTNENNGALRVIPKSHLNGICRPEKSDLTNSFEFICNVGKGGIMIMKPLLLHSSGRTINNKKRRVIHVEFSNIELPAELKWSERMNCVSV
jgi:ectoine hydroxylase-related dioxygenase (phytanoyl-CoA dioxygenase family)